MGNQRNRRSRRVESQWPDREEHTSETSFVQGDATLSNVSENVDNFFDRNLGSELTELSQIFIEIEVFSRRLAKAIITVHLQAKSPQTLFCACMSSNSADMS